MMSYTPTEEQNEIVKAAIENKKLNIAAASGTGKEVENHPRQVLLRRGSQGS